MFNPPLVQDPVAVLAVLLAVLAGLFGAAGTKTGRGFFNVVPLLVFAYFLPTLLSNTGVIPVESSLYGFIKDWLLPASLILFTMSADIPAVMRLGRKQLVLFLAGTATIVIGGPLAYLALRGLVPASEADQAWRGLAALSGSWIGGTANFVAIAESVEAGKDIVGKIIVVDVALANIWMAPAPVLRRSRGEYGPLESAPIGLAWKNFDARARSFSCRLHESQAFPTCF